MKTRIAMFLAVAMAAICACADTWTDPDTGYTWTYRINGDEAEIYNYYWSCALLPLPTGTMSIPSMLGSKPVTRIGDYAFCGCTNLTHLTIPDSVKSIGYCAFYDCRGLARLTIPDSVTSIESRAFESCSGLESILVGVNNPNYSSANGLLLSKDGKTLIQGVNGDVVIPDCVRSIGGRAFACCYGLTSVTIDNGVTSIEGTAFYGCSALTSVVLPDSVTSISSIAFVKCSSLTSIYIPANMTNIVWGSFAPITSDYNGLTNISVSVDNRKYKSVNGLLLTIDGTTLLKGINGEVVIPDGVTSIEFGAFAGCGSLKSVTIPNSVESIGSQAFEACVSLTNVVIPASVTNIEHNVFAGCDRLLSIDVSANNPSYKSVSGLLLMNGGKDLMAVPVGKTTVTIPNGVTSIGDRAFEGCRFLSRVELPGTVTSIGFCAFYGCSSLKCMIIPDSMISIEDLAFEGCSDLLYDVSTIPGVKLVDGWAIGYARGLRNLDLCGVRGVGYGAFWDCVSLTNVTISGNVKHVGSSAFYGCDALTSVNIDDGVESFGYCAFSECNALKHVMIPASVTNVGSAAAFTRCRGMLSYEVADGNPSYKSVSGLLLTKDGEKLICGINGDVIIPDGVEEICSSAFEGCEGLTSILIPESVSSIGYSAFSECKSLIEVTIPSGVSFLEPFTFSECVSLKSVVFEGDAPHCFFSFSGVNSECVAYVHRDSQGWGVEIPGIWNGLRIEYVEGGAQDIWTVTFDAQGGTLEEVTRSVTNECAVSKLPAAVQEGFAFDGWFTAAEGGNVVTAETIVTGDVTYYAHWTENVEPEPTPEPTPTSEPTPTPEPEPSPEPEPEEVYELNDGEVDGAAPTTAASEYNGYLYDANGGAVKGTIQVKVGKPGKKDGKASVKATVVIGTKKVTLKAKDKGKAAIEKDGPTEIELVGGEACEIVLGAEGLTGYYGAYLIDGSRNFFASKDKGEVTVVNDILSKWLGSFMVVWDGGSLSVSIAAKGKVKVSGKLADGKTKVSVSTVLLVGEEWSCVSIAAQKANLAFVLWLSHDGQTIVAEGLGDDVLVGKPGALANGVAFHVDADEFASVFGQTMLPYLPDGVPVSQKGTKWTLPKAGKVVYKNGAVDESKLGENPSGLKLSYKAKDGSFKGSFKVYAVDGSKVKATTVTITGVLVNGVGYGAATIKDKGSVAVTIE